MNISLSTSSSYSSLSVSSTGSAQKHHKNGVIEDAAKALGMDAKDLVSELKDGKSLGDIADEKGVSRDDLATALKAGMPDDLKNSGNADQVVDKIINQVGLPQRGGHQGPPPPPPSTSSSSGVYGDSLTSDQQSTLSKLADLLGTDSTSLIDDLKSGESLSTMLSNKGVSESKLSDVVQSGLLIDATA